MSKKFNIIDVAVVLLVIVAILGFAVRFGSSATDSVNSKVKFRYTMQIDSVRSFTVDALRKKGVVTDEDSTISFGEIIDVQTNYATKVNSLSNGTVVSPKVPEKYSCLVTIEAIGSESDNKYLLEDTTELAVGRTTDLVTKYVHTSGIIKSVEVIE